jgi:nucleoside-diphosphate-sugar epimerase
VARYLVTGGAGFIGSHLAERLLRDGHLVRIVDNLSTGRKSNLETVRAAGSPTTFEWMEGDIRSLDTCRRACDGVDYVLHQAALASVPRSIENPVDTTAVNVSGTLNVLAAAKEHGVRRVVCASSSSVYGDSESLPKHEELPTCPLSPYAASKLAGEVYARVYARTMGLSTLSLRYFNVFGPRQDPGSQYAAVIPRFITALRDEGRPVVYGDGLQSRDFTYIDNVVAANLEACLAANGNGDAMNVACGDRYTLLDLLGVLGNLLGVTPNPEFQPARTGDVKHSQASIERARRVLGFIPRIGFEEGLARTVAYFRGAD